MTRKKPLIEVHRDLLLFLSNLPPPQRNKILSILKKKQINSISEIFTNFLKSNLTQDENTIKKLKKYKKEIQTVAKKRSPYRLKLKVLKSKRGGAILSALLPIAASLISGLLLK